MAKRYKTEAACLKQLAQLRWPDGFQCPHCGHDHGYYTSRRKHYECAACHRQTSITAGTLFHATKLPLVKWFWAIYWVATDKGSISALRLSKLIGVNWRSAFRILDQLRTAMGHQDSIYPALCSNCTLRTHGQSHRPWHPGVELNAPAGRHASTLPADSRSPHLIGTGDF